MIVDYIVYIIRYLKSWSMTRGSAFPPSHLCEAAHVLPHYHGWDSLEQLPFSMFETKKLPLYDDSVKIYTYIYIYVYIWLYNDFVGIYRNEAKGGNYNVLPCPRLEGFSTRLPVLT